MSVLNQARLRSGVLAPAQFAFLKLVDRRLWYAIGAGAHWAAERAVGAPIPTPEFDQAIAAIRPKTA
jgi:intracellular multiplication protein IcmP